MLIIEDMHSTVSDEALRLVALFCGRNVADKLLYEGEPNVGTIRAATEIDTRTVTRRNTHRSGFIPNRQTL